MSTLFQSSLRNPFGPSLDTTARPRSMAVLSQNNTSPRSPGHESMNMTSPSRTNMGPPEKSSPEAEQNILMNGNRDQNTSPAPNSSSANQGPKVVQTAFIHKLYSMLEDKSIQHLIAWSQTNESFIVSPNNEFSKVLAQYFKHTNISSFVRQLNMYGFHKVSDVFHTGSPESAQWEFKHGNGSFKKGDLMGLREIKRRASRHTLIHRDSFSGTKPGPAQPTTPAELMPDNDSRLAHLEHAYFDMHARLTRMEDNYGLLSQRCSTLTDTLVRCHQWTQGLSSGLQQLVPPESALYADVASMQREISRQLDYIRGMDAPQEPQMNGRHSYYPGPAMDGPLSPRGYFSDSRRSSIQMPEPQHVGLRPPIPPLPPQFSANSPRRFGSISLPQTSPGFSRPPLPVDRQPHPLSNVETAPANGLARRHTSADIRDHGWPLPHTTNGSPYESGQSSVHWQPSSPDHHGGGGGDHTHNHIQPSTAADQAIRDQLAQYDINAPRGSHALTLRNQPTPPSIPEEPHIGLGMGPGGLGFGNFKFPRPSFELHSAPATRRSSMAHLLNPADTIERDEEADGPIEERKRKRYG